MERFRQLAVAAVLMAIGSGPTTAGAQSLNGVVTIFDLVGGISAGDIVVLVNDPADPIGIATVYGRQYVLGTVDGAPLRAFLETDLFNAQATRLVVDGAVLRITTTATSLGAVDASSETTVRGVIDNDEVSLSFIGPGFNLVTQDRVTVTVNGESLHIRVPPGQSLRALQVDTPVTVAVGGTTVFTGTAVEFQNAILSGDLAIATPLNLVNPVTSAGFEVQQVHSGRAIQRSRDRITQAFISTSHRRTGTPRQTAAGDGLAANQQLAMAAGVGRDGYGGPIASSVARIDTLTGEPAEAAFTLWADLDYTDFGSDDVVVRTDGDMISGAIGLDAVIDRSVLVGLSAGYDLLEVNTGASGANRLEADILNLSPYAALSLLDGRVVPEAMLTFALMDVETRTSLGATGDTDGLAVVGRLGTSVQQPLGGGVFVVGAFGGIELGYQRINGFTDSAGVTTDANETWAGTADLGIRGSIRLLNRLSATGSAAYVVDYSGNLTEDFYIDRLSDDYAELGGELVWQPIDPFALNAGGSVKLGMDDRHEYSLGGGARVHF